MSPGLIVDCPHLVAGSAAWLAGAGGGRSQGLASGVVGALSVGVAVEVEHHGAVKEPVEQRCGDGGVAQDIPPGSWKWHTFRCE